MTAHKRRNKIRARLNKYMQGQRRSGHYAFITIWNWYYYNRNDETLPDKVINALQWSAYEDKRYSDEYGYTGNWRSHLEYCFDRMNSGRAKAILRLYYEQTGGAK